MHDHPSRRKSREYFRVIRLGAGASQMAGEPPQATLRGAVIRVRVREQSGDGDRTESTIAPYRGDD